VGGQVFVNSRASDDRKASAQSINTIVTSGLGSFLGCLLAGEVVAAFPDRFGMVFLVPGAINAVLLLVLVLKFRPSTVARVSAPATRPNVGRVPRTSLPATLEG
jgi:hypothetical protein